MSFTNNFSGSSLSFCPELVDFESDEVDITAYEDVFIKEIDRLVDSGLTNTASLGDDGPQRRDSLESLAESADIISHSSGSSLDDSLDQHTLSSDSNGPLNTWMGYLSSVRDTEDMFLMSPATSAFDAHGSAPQAEAPSGIFSRIFGSSVYSLQDSEAAGHTDSAQDRETSSEETSEQPLDDERDQVCNVTVVSRSNEVEELWECSSTSTWDNEVDNVRESTPEISVNRPDDEIEELWECSSASTLDSEAENIREPTPELSLTWSTSPSPGVEPLTPCDEVREKQDPGHTDAPPERRKRQCTLLRPGAFSKSNAGCSSDRASKKRKQSIGDDDRIEEQDENQDSRNEQLPSKGLSKRFKLQFLLSRFDFTTSQDTHECPFQGTAHRTLDCWRKWTSAQFLHHIRCHCVDFEERHPGEALDCPLKGNNKCRWRDETAKEVSQIGANDGLGRHILDGHFKGRSTQCPCGSTVTRGTRDQVVRHLVTSEYRRNLDTLKRQNPRFPAYPDIRDPQLLVEQTAWLNAQGEVDEDSRKGRKRARRC